MKHGIFPSVGTGDNDASQITSNRQSKEVVKRATAAIWVKVLRGSSNERVRDVTTTSRIEISFTICRFACSLHAPGRAMNYSMKRAFYSGIFSVLVGLVQPVMAREFTVRVH